jgi:SMC interacting uncharacterized protein involved in chromosome segregation
MNEINLEDLKHDISNMSDRGRKIVYELTQIEKEMAIKKNSLNVLSRARQAYISDLKNEIVRKKAGIEFINE